MTFDGLAALLVALFWIALTALALDLSGYVASYDWNQWTDPELRFRARGDIQPEEFYRRHISMIGL